MFEAAFVLGICAREQIDAGQLLVHDGELPLLSELVGSENLLNYLEDWGEPYNLAGGVLGVDGLFDEQQLTDRL